MDRRVIWVHGIGQHGPGYSASWEASFNPYLQLTHSDFVEVVWDSVFNPPRPRSRTRAAAGPPLTGRERAAEAEVRNHLRAVLQARSSALAVPPPGSRARGPVDGVVEWSERYGLEFAPSAGPGTRGFLPAWLTNPDAYLGDFTKYLVSRRLRTAVKEEAKKQLRPLLPLVTGGGRLALITHSWGTVVAYEALLDLERELPALTVAHLFTLGSPLWMVQPFLQERSGRKPVTLTNWTNIHARGDLVGSWLKPAFGVEADYEVPSQGGDAHGSYFTSGNVQVQRDIVAQRILSS